MFAFIFDCDCGESLLEDCDCDSRETEKSQCVHQRLGVFKYQGERVIVKQGKYNSNTKQFQTEKEFEGIDFNSYIKHIPAEYVLLHWIREDKKVQGLFIEEKDILGVAKKIVQLEGKTAFLILTKKKDYYILRENKPTYREKSTFQMLKEMPSDILNPVENRNKCAAIIRDLKDYGFQGKDLLLTEENLSNSVNNINEREIRELKLEFKDDRATLVWVEANGLVKGLHLEERDISQLNRQKFEINNREAYVISTSSKTYLFRM